MKVQKDDNDRHYHELPKLDPSQLHFVGDIGNWRAQSKNDPLIFRPFFKVK